jgi:hypothetical protein
MTAYYRVDPAVSSIHIIWGPMALLIIAVVGFFRDFLSLLPPCIFHKLTGIPCLTCGGTRSLAALSQFDIASSFMLNPVLFLCVAGVMTLSSVSFYGFVTKGSIVLKLSDGHKKALRIGIIGLFIANWVYLIFAGR